jgi:hypothetical protein
LFSGDWEEQMKRIVILIGLLVLLQGCGQNNSNPPPPQNASTASLMNIPSLPQAGTPTSSSPVQFPPSLCTVAGLQQLLAVLPAGITVYGLPTNTLATYLGLIAPMCPILKNLGPVVAQSLVNECQTLTSSYPVPCTCSQIINSCL